MSVKNISIMEDAYRLLLARKGKNESFSDVIRRTMKNKSSLKDVSGAWKHLADKDTEKVKEEIRLLRKKSTKELTHQ